MTLWSGPRTVVRLRFPTTDDQIAHVNTMSDEAIERNLARLGVDPIPATAAERRTRLESWPTQVDLDQVATAHVASNGGVRPTARVLEVVPGHRGAAGSTPR